MKESVLVRMPSELKRSLQARAKALGVSTTALILNILWDAANKKKHRAS